MKTYTVYSYPVTNKEIRGYFLRDYRNLAVVIRRNGDVVVKTTRQRGDGGKMPWNMFAGNVREIRFDVAESILCNQ